MRGAMPPLPEYAFIAWCSVTGTLHAGEFYITNNVISWKGPWAVGCTCLI